VLLFVLFSGVIFNVKISAQNNNEQLEMDQSLVENYESTILANKIWSKLQNNKKGNEYPEDYSGMYIDENDDLVICLRQESLLDLKSSILKYTTEFNLTSETNYKFVNQKYNLTQLLQIKTTLENQHYFDFYIIAISQKDNIVKITVENISKKTFYWIF